ncbi:MAG: hypothetical protein AAFX02_07240 [Pseudomonadota bacterium]
MPRLITGAFGNIRRKGPVDLFERPGWFGKRRWSLGVTPAKRSAEPERGGVLSFVMAVRLGASLGRNDENKKLGE